jgi:ectoine hydroxylase-related dioxygenase (phytanoyl-CoA dioxygenase family)
VTAAADIRTTPQGWLTEDDCDIEDFRAIVATVTERRDFPHADAIEDNVVVYEGQRLRGWLRTSTTRKEVQAELIHALLTGPGLVVVKDAFADRADVDRVSEAFQAMIDQQHRSGSVVGDHFARPGANERVWNALEKLALRDPAAFAAYYANDIIAAVSSAWLGPGYQITSQVNVVNPGGAAQAPHRDYHLGFQSADMAAQYPAHVHRLSPVLTLQGAVAHVDMPTETGPTMYLPHSQKFEAGYLVWPRPEFRDEFDRRHVQLALAKGDAVFFNPALFHAAGHNRSGDVRRMANLLQISSAFGRAMESVDREKMCLALLPTLVAFKAAGAPPAALDNVIAATAEGYAFPTNLDRDPPVDGLAPESQAEMLRRAVDEGWELDALRPALRAHAERRVTVAH